LDTFVEDIVTLGPLYGTGILIRGWRRTSLFLPHPSTRAASN